MKPRPLKKLANIIICSFLPEKVTYGNSIIALNPEDPVISGALALRVYEKSETDFVLSHLNKGDIFLDIGANVGFYTAIASNIVGKNGVVVACEPDPNSLHYLYKTSSLNSQHNNITIVDKAITDKTGINTLFVSGSNRGDNRLHKFDESSDKFNVNTTTVDELFFELKLNKNTNPLFIKIDVQGSEGLVLSGMKNTIRTFANVTLIMEFWPKALSNMKTSPVALLTSLELQGFKLFDLRHAGRKSVPISEKDQFIAQYKGRNYTNIIAIKDHSGKTSDK